MTTIRTKGPKHSLHEPLGLQKGLPSLLSSRTDQWSRGESRSPFDAAGSGLIGFAGFIARIGRV